MGCTTRRNEASGMDRDFNGGFLPSQVLLGVFCAKYPWLANHQHFLVPRRVVPKGKERACILACIVYFRREPNYSRVWLLLMSMHLSSQNGGRGHHICDYQRDFYFKSRVICWLILPSTATLIQAIS